MKTIGEVQTFFDSIKVDASSISLGVDRCDQYLSIFEENGQFVVCIPEDRGTHIARFDSEEGAVAEILQNIWFFLKFKDRQHANTILHLLRSSGYMKF